MKQRGVMEAERAKLEAEVCECLKVLATADQLSPGDLGDFYIADFTARGEQLRQLPYRVPEEENDLPGAASVLAQMAFLAIDLSTTTNGMGPKPPFRGPYDTVRESAVALGRVLLGEPGEEETAEGEGEPAPILRAQLDDKAARLLELWARAADTAPETHFAEFSQVAEGLWELGDLLRTTEPPDRRGAYRDELCRDAEARIKSERAARRQGAVETRVLAPQMRARRNVNAAAGILAEVFNQVCSMELEFLLDNPKGEIDEGINKVRSALQELMLKVGRLLTQDGPAIQVGEREEERWIMPDEDPHGSLVVVNGSKE